VHAPGVPPLPPGAGAFHAAVMLWREAFPDIHVTVEDVVGEGNEVYCRFTTRGTHTGPLMGIPATGKPVTVHEMSCHQLTGGKVTQSWIGDNVPSILAQIGALAPASHRSVIVARITPGAEQEVARIWAESDTTDLPRIAGVRRRELYTLGDLYIHILETERPGEQAVGAAREQEEFARISEALSAYISPYLPSWRSPQDAVAARFYSWEPK
jgi:predicted ester cyclase